MPNTWSDFNRATLLSRAAVTILLLTISGGQLFAGEPGTEASSNAPQQNFILRHVEIEQWEIGVRYRYMDRQPRVVTDRDLQLKSSLKLDVDLWKKVTVIKLRAETGPSFTSSWSYSGVGMQKQALACNVKSVYLSQKIGDRLTAQLGSLEFDRGAGTEATYADNDGWMEGYRLGVVAWKSSQWKPDRIGVTVGYIGDFKMPNAFARLHRLGEPNYTQVIAGKQIGDRRQTSVEFDSIQGVSYFRPALRWGGRYISPVLDEVVLEGMIRGNKGGETGWAATGSRKLGAFRRWNVYATYSDVPPGLLRKNSADILLNGDSMALGRRLGSGLRFLPLGDLELSAFASRRLESTNLAPRWRGQLAVRYQLGDVINRALR